MIICLDFDNVIHDSKNIDKGRKMGKPLPGALEGVEKLLESHELVIHTNRVKDTFDTGHIMSWLDYFNFPEIPISISKPQADLYLDDKGFKFTSWENTLKLLSLLDKD